MNRFHGCIGALAGVYTAMHMQEEPTGHVALDGKARLLAAAREELVVCFFSEAEIPINDLAFREGSLKIIRTMLIPAKQMAHFRHSPQLSVLKECVAETSPKIDSLAIERADNATAEKATLYLCNL